MALTCLVLATLTSMTLTTLQARPPAEEPTPPVTPDPNAQDFDLQSILSPSLVDYPGFLQQATEVDGLRHQRMLGLEDFLATAKEPGVIVLDTRSKAAYDAKHLAGSVHLNFSDFGTEKLASVIPSLDTKVLIYCNNNIDRDPQHFISKSPPMALNIPTFINLHGYGYTNVWELSDLVDADDPRLTFEGTAVGGEN
ncbi:MAG: rhodanese-like domain-containing protein [Acidobacteriota bacterium]